MVNLKVLCTGIPGSRRDLYIKQMMKIAYSKGKEITYYHLFDYIVQKAKDKGFKIHKLNILGMFSTRPDRIRTFRRIAIDGIIEKMSNKQGVHIISTPYHFEWKGASLEGLSESEIKKLNPDIFIVVIDDVARVKERLKQDDQWREHKFTLGEIAKWRREEIKGIWDFAHSFRPPKEVFILAIEHDPRVFYDLIFEREKKKVYLSYPITGVAPEIVRKEREFKQTIGDYYVVFDPLTIHDWAIVAKWKTMKDSPQGLPSFFKCKIDYESGPIEYECNSKEVEFAIKDIRRQIVDRDYKLIDSSEYVIVYHPRKSVSAGVVCEMVHAKGGGKMVYAMYPFEPSPFFEYYTNRIFENEIELIKFLQGIA